MSGIILKILEILAEIALILARELPFHHAPCRPSSGPVVSVTESNPMAGTSTVTVVLPAPGPNALSQTLTVTDTTAGTPPVVTPNFSSGSTIPGLTIGDSVDFSYQEVNNAGASGSSPVTTVVITDVSGGGVPATPTVGPTVTVTSTP